jgi:hypothetical protein
MRSFRAQEDVGLKADPQDVAPACGSGFGLTGRAA